MDHFLNKIKSNEKKQHFLLYCYTFFIMGAMLNGIGPLIPYMSQAFKVSEIQYSMLFPGRTLGYFIGTLLAKILIKKYTNHTLMIYSVVGFSATSICFNFSSNISWQVFYICINAVALAFYDIITNTILLIFNKDKDKAFWVQTGHGMFGVGSLTSPIIAYFCELNTFMFFAMMNIIMVFGYYNLESPQNDNNNHFKQMSEFFLNNNQSTDQIYAQTDHQIAENQHNFVTQTSLEIELRQKKMMQRKLKPITYKMLIYLTILYFLYFGLESSYSVWIPTYSVLAKISSKEEATAYSLVFYLSMAISRFVLAIPTKSKTSSRTQFSLLLLLIISVLAVLLHFTYPHFGCYFVSILYGFAMSPLYSWYLAISHQYGYQLKSSDYSSILIVSMFGPTIFPMIIGYLFQISLSMIFIGVFIMGLLQYIFLVQLQKQYASEINKEIQKAQQNKIIKEAVE